MVVLGKGKTMADAENILSRVRGIVADEFVVGLETLGPDTRFKEDLTANSLNMVCILYAVSEAFGMEISDEETEGIKTVGDLCQCVQCLQSFQ